MPFDHELKLGRALKHLRDLEAQTRSWLKTNPCTIRYEVDLDRDWGSAPPLTDDGFYMLGGHVTIPLPSNEGFVMPPDAQFGEGIITAFATAKEPLSDTTSLLIGDMLHNLRSSLDVLAYSLASAHTSPLPQDVAQSSEFPIFGDEKGQGTGATRFSRRNKKGDADRGSGLAKIAGWHPDAQTAVEGLQPYQRGDDFRSDPLWVLHELDRVSKHRLLHPVVAGFDGADWNVAASRNVGAIGPGFISTTKGTVETDTPIGRIAGVHVVDPNAQVYVELNPVLDVAFSKAAPAAQEEQVVATLGGIYNYVLTDVLPPLAGFLK